jgi:hypothetical protein
MRRRHAEQDDLHCIIYTDGVWTASRCNNPANALTAGTTPQFN